MFTHSVKNYVAVSIVCLILIALDKQFDLTKSNCYMLKSALFSFPFFAIGYMIKDYLMVKINVIVKLFVIIIGLVLSYIVVTKLTSISIAEVFYYSLIVNVPLAVLCSISVVFFSQLITPFIKCNFFKDLSRGTMIILGIHTILFFDIFPQYFFDPQPLRFALIKTVLTLLLFYVVIKLTYRRFPILYGKKS